jgi:hypothetical protein
MHRMAMHGDNFIALPELSAKRKRESKGQEQEM